MKAHKPAPISGVWRRPDSRRRHQCRICDRITCINRMCYVIIIRRCQIVDEPPWKLHTYTHTQLEAVSEFIAKGWQAGSRRVGAVVSNTNRMQTARIILLVWWYINVYACICWYATCQYLLYCSLYSTTHISAYPYAPLTPDFRCTASLERRL